MFIATDILKDIGLASMVTSHSRSEQKSKLRVKNYGSEGAHGAREMARRKRQIECGQLKRENGLAA